MVLRLKLKINIEEVRDAFEKVPGRMREAIATGIDRASEIVEKAAKINLTRNQSVAFGVLRASIGHKTDRRMLSSVIGPGLASKGQTPGGDPASYGLFVEFGRGPGKRPPARALELWVKRKLGISDAKEIDRISFLISRKIGKAGIAAAPFLEPALKDNEAKISERIGREIDREIARINAEGRA